MPKTRRIFLAINLPEAAKKQLLSFQTRWNDLPARWVQAQNLHLTLAFLGNTSDEELELLLDIAQGVAAEHKAFEISVEEIQYGPDARMPRMVWATIAKTRELSSIQHDLTKALSEKLPFKPEKRGFTPHLTLARLSMTQFRSMEREEQPRIQEEIRVSFPAQAIDIMESRLKRSGAEYEILLRVPFAS